MNLRGLEHIVKENFLLSSVSSMKTGGRAELAFFPGNEDEFVEILVRTSGHKARYIIGNASNVLFPDDASGLCIIFTSAMNKTLKKESLCIYAECGAMLTAVSVLAKEASLSGLEFAYGIPGTVGGGIYMNAGAYGGELSQVVKNIRAYDSANDRFILLSGDECKFSYRHSIFMEKPELAVMGAEFALKVGEREDIEALCRKNMQSRREKQPLEYPSCGSAFKRPEGNFAGKLIEDCGLKGFCIGKAAVSEKHAGFIINLGGATSADVKALILVIKNRVYNKFGVELQPEIQIIENK